jgi:AcrR family transcriptional regulator
MMKKAKKSKAPPAARRERIVAAALEAFVANGIGPTTLRDVAKRAGVDPPLIHYYFPDMESLHLAVILVALEDLKHYSLREADKWSTRPEKWMEEYLKAPLNWARDRSELLFLWVYFYTLACKPGVFRDLNQQIRKVGRDRITLKVFEGIEKGAFKLGPGLSAADAALEIQTLMTGASLVFATESDIPYAAAVKSLQRRAFSVLGVSS